MATPASIAEILTARGAGGKVYLAADHAIWSVSSGGEAERLFEAPPDAVLLDIDASPSARHVAALLQTRNGDRPSSEVLILDDTGEIVERFGDIGVPIATPGPGGAAGAAIDWSPQGDRALVLSERGGLVSLPIGDGGEPTPLDLGSDVRSVVAPAWSPTGQSVAFIAVDGDGTRTLNVLDTTGGTVAEAVVPGPGRTVVEFAWMPDGVSLLFTEGGEPGGAITGIDLWRVDADGENRQLVASAGTVAPVARIANARPAPDGRSVAYTVLVPGAGSPQVDSVWVRDLASKLGFRIALPSVAAVNEIWWTDQGLVFSVITGGGQGGRQATQALLLVDREGSVRALWAAPVARGTPAAATAVATPILAE